MGPFSKDFLGLYFVDSMRGGDVKCFSSDCNDTQTTLTPEVELKCELVFKRLHKECQKLPNVAKKKYKNFKIGILRKCGLKPSIIYVAPNPPIQIFSSNLLTFAVLMLYRILLLIAAMKGSFCQNFISLSP